jgi:GTP-binding protein
VAGSRADLAPPETRAAFDGLEVSAVTGHGVPQLLGALASVVREAREAAETAEGYAIHRPAPEGVRVERQPDGSFDVLGRPALRAVAVSDLTNLEALDYVRHRLKGLGVDKALVRAGARTGDVVRIGAFEFEYEED